MQDRPQATNASTLNYSTIPSRQGMTPQSVRQHHVAARHEGMPTRLHYPRRHIPVHRRVACCCVVGCAREREARAQRKAELDRLALGEERVHTAATPESARATIVQSAMKAIAGASGCWSRSASSAGVQLRVWGLGSAV